jgi:sulfur carrier protein
MTPITDALQLVLNGAPAEAPAGSSVSDLLRQHGQDPEQRGIAVAVNGRVVRRALWRETELTAGDEVEVITATQGG